MKFIVAIILTALLAFIGGVYMPWWSLAIAAFIISLLIPQKGGKAFLSGFLGVFLLWAILAWWINMKNESILAKKIAEILHLGGNEYFLILVTAFVGGLVGGFASLSASFLRSSNK
ncbi:MAG: hypothetical protein JST17_00145 [Bacteroidetes bacterium]|nr:hypothetical protein [Bacteroidota bacterium]MBS1932225.1 hypothetical protein [Bacteroidota bacterium]